MASRGDGGDLDDFGRAHGLTPGTDGELPHTGTLLTVAGLDLDGAAHGELPGDATGVTFTCTWVTRSDDTTTTHRRTAVVIRLPESMGYAPYLAIGRLFSATPRNVGVRRFEPAQDVPVLADEGIDEGWLTELFSPAFSEWLQRSPEGFGAELDAGVLVVARDGHLYGDEKLVQLCADAARIAQEIHSEVLEEVEQGGGSVAKPAAPDQRTQIGIAMIPALGLEGPPANIESALGTAQSHARRLPGAILSTITGTLAIMLGVNIIGGGIYGLLLTVGDPLTNVLIWQAILFVVIGFLRFRHVTNDIARKASAEAFWQGYERTNDLTEVDPLRFSAEHAEANLPGKPIRVLQGLFGGTPGFLMLTGEGRERGDKIALVRGPKGPIAVADLNLSAPGPSTTGLDEHVATLLLDLETQPAQPGSGEAGSGATAG